MNPKKDFKKALAALETVITDAAVDDQTVFALTAIRGALTAIDARLVALEPPDVPKPIACAECAAVLFEAASPYNRTDDTIDLADVHCDEGTGHGHDVRWSDGLVTVVPHLGKPYVLKEVKLARRKEPTHLSPGHTSPVCIHPACIAFREAHPLLEPHKDCGYWHALSIPDGDGKVDAMECDGCGLVQSVLGNA